jgi:hypothetical protein
VPRSHLDPEAPPPIVTPRLVLRLVILLATLGLILLLAARTKQPHVWAWVGAGAAPTPAHESQAPKADGPRRAPFPEEDILAGAADGEPFLVENPDLILETEKQQRARRDADARYHLLLLAKSAAPGSLQANARFDLRYSQLKHKPRSCRGEIVGIRGTVVSITPMELQRELPDVPVCYQAQVTVDVPDQRYWVIFTDLPPGLPPENQWRGLYLHQVFIAGYFLKVLRMENPREPKQPLLLPVLVAKTLDLPPATADTAWNEVAIIFGLAAIPVLVVGLFAWWYYAHTEAALRDRINQTKRRRTERDRAAVLDLEAQGFRAAGDPDASAAADEVNVNGVDGSGDQQ